MSKLFTRATVSGATLAGANLKAAWTVLWDALGTAGFSDSSRATVSTTSTLATTQCGLLLIDATAGSIVLTLPASGASADDAFYNMRRIDSSANTVTVQRAGADTVNGGVSITIPVSGKTEIQLPAGSINWRSLSVAEAGANTIYTTAGTATAYTITPVPAYTAYAIGMSVMVNFALASGASPTIVWNGIATPPQLVKENSDGTYSNIAAGDIPINHRSRVTLISTTQALVEKIKPDAMVKLSTATAAASATLDFTNLAGYSAILFVLKNVRPTTNASAVYLRISQDNGSTFKAGATDYRDCVQNQTSAAAGGIGATNGAAQIRLEYAGPGLSNNAASGLSGEIWLVNADSTSKYKTVNFDLAYTVDASGNSGHTNGSGQYITDTAAINAIRFFSNSATLADGSIDCYGIRN